MGRQLSITGAEMRRAGWVFDPIVTQEGFVCPDCGGHDSTCGYCAGQGDGRTQIEYGWKKGDIRVRSYTEKDFCWDSNPCGPSQEYHREVGLLNLKHRFI